jgi:hypothetical protein
VSHSSLPIQRLTFARAIQAEDWIVVAWHPSLSRKHFVVRIEMGLAVEAY